MATKRVKATKATRKTQGSIQKYRNGEPIPHNNGTDIQIISARNLLVTWGFQRISLNSSKAAKIAKNFDWNHVHTLLVAPRPGGLFSILDGGHRFEAIRIKHPEFIDEDGREVMVRCEVKKKSRKIGGRYVDEAECFLGANGNSSSVNANDSFKAERYAGRTHAVKTYDIALKHGVEIVFRQPGSKGYGKSGPNQTIHGGVLSKALILLKESKYRFMIRLLAKFKDEEGNIQSKALQATFLNGLMSFLDATSMNQTEIMEAVSHCDSVANIVERAWMKSRTGYERPQVTSHEIQVAMLKAWHGRRK